MILVTGVIKLNTTPLEGRLDSTHKRPSYLLIGTYPSQRYVSVWRSVNRSGSLLSTWRPALFTHWSLRGNTEVPHWVVTRGRSLLALRPRCSITVTQKGSMLSVIGLFFPKQESASLLTTRIIAALATPGLGLVQEGNMMTLTHVETRLRRHRIMEINTLKPLVTFWFIESKEKRGQFI